MVEIDADGDFPRLNMERLPDLELTFAQGSHVRIYLDKGSGMILASQ